MPTPAVSRTLASAMRALPIKTVSRLAGGLASARLPGPVLRAVIRGFGSAFEIDFDEARDPVESFGSFQEFFTRRLREGVRPIDPDPRAFVSPCDGAWGAAGTIEAGRLLQVKGRDYEVAALLGDAAEARRLEGGAFATLYLSPRDYHRFHTPCDLEVVAASYLPGRLWPVNGIGLHGVEGLFAENERICAWMRPVGSAEPPPLCLVAVGATMVGSVKVEFDDLTTNQPGASPTRRHYDPPISFGRGDEWGRFEFGSTIVLVAAPGFLDLEIAETGTPVRLGTRIGTLC